jgi:hypothetical protein
MQVVLNGFAASSELWSIPSPAIPCLTVYLKMPPMVRISRLIWILHIVWTFGRLVFNAFWIVQRVSTRASNTMCSRENALSRQSEFFWQILMAVSTFYKSSRLVVCALENNLSPQAGNSLQLFASLLVNSRLSCRQPSLFAEVVHIGRHVNLIS